MRCISSLMPWSDVASCESGFHNGRYFGCLFIGDIGVRV
jgi:hypothetical protein